MMTIEQIRARIEEIRSNKSDPDKAHTLEDELLWDFVRYIHSTGNKDGLLKEKAELILTSQDIEFQRWTS